MVNSLPSKNQRTFMRNTRIVWETKQKEWDARWRLHVILIPTEHSMILKSESLDETASFCFLHVWKWMCYFYGIPLLSVLLWLTIPRTVMMMASKDIMLWLFIFSMTHQVVLSAGILTASPSYSLVCVPQQTREIVSRIFMQWWSRRLKIPWIFSRKNRKKTA
jgi:hypothetical protein